MAATTGAELPVAAATRAIRVCQYSILRKQHSLTHFEARAATVRAAAMARASRVAAAEDGRDSQHLPPYLKHRTSVQMALSFPP